MSELNDMIYLFVKLGKLVNMLRLYCICVMYIWFNDKCIMIFIK